MVKPFFYVIHVIHLLLLQFCFSNTACGQEIYVDLKIKKYTEHISSLSKDEMERKLRDTILNTPRRYSLIKARPRLRFDKDSQFEFKIQVEVIDSTIQGALATKIKCKIYEQNILPHLQPTTTWLVVSYTDRDGIVKEEGEVLDNYFSWIPIHFNHCLSLIPLKSDLSLKALNLPHDSIGKLESFKEVVVNFDYPVELEEASSINHLFLDVLHKQQEFYWSVRSQRKGFFNLLEKPQETSTQNPILITFSILREGDSYRVRLIVKGNLNLKSHMVNVPEIIEFSQDQLIYAPTQVVEKIDNLLGSLFRINLD